MREWESWYGIGRGRENGRKIKSGEGVKEGKVLMKELGRINELVRMKDRR